MTETAAGYFASVDLAKGEDFTTLVRGRFLPDGRVVVDAITDMTEMDEVSVLWEVLTVTVAVIIGPEDAPCPFAGGGVLDEGDGLHVTDEDPECYAKAGTGTCVECVIEALEERVEAGRTP